VGEWVTSRQSDVKDDTEARHTTREELDRRSLHIGMMDLVVEGCSEDCSAPGAALAGLQSPLELARHNLRHGLNSAKGRSIWAQLRKDDWKLHGIGNVDWISSKI
jgi:hypothetical protein